MSAFSFGAPSIDMAFKGSTGQQDLAKATKSFDDRPAGNRYEELKVLREQERLDAIRRGIIDDPDNKRALAEAKVFVGTCEDMCPAFEREQREYQNDVNRLEVSPVTGRIDRQYAVTAFHRSAAGNEQSLPSDIRPPAVLLKTMEYLVDKILCGPEPLAETHGFVRDRTRSIRTDLTVQNYRGEEAVMLTECIARFHVLSAHLMCEVEGFSQQQEAEQLRKSLQSLSEYYDDRRRQGLTNQNEPELRAYNILTRLRDPDVLRQAQALPGDIRRSGPVRQALKLYSLAQRSNEEVGRFKPPNSEGSLNLFRRFFKEVASSRTTYLMACLCETHFSDVRKGALKALRKAFRAQHRNLPLSDVASALMYDDEEQAAFECRHYGIAIHADGSGIALADLTTKSSFDESGVAIEQRLSQILVESKRGGTSLRRVIYGDASGGAISMPPPAQIPTRKRSMALTQPVERPVPPPVQAWSTTTALQSATSNRSISSTQSASTSAGGTGATSAPMLAGPVARPAPVASVKAEPSKEEIARRRLVEAQRAEADLRARHAMQLATAQEHAETRHREELLATMARDAALKMLRAEIDAQMLESYARYMDERRLKHSVFYRIRLACDEIQRRAQDQDAKLAEEAEMEIVYDNVLRDLTTVDNAQPTRRKRKRRRTRAASPSGKVQVTEASLQRDLFWKPLDVRSLLTELRIDQTAVIYIDVRQSDSAMIDWFRTKFKLTDGISFDIGLHGQAIRIELLTEQTEIVAGAAALIYHESSIDASSLAQASSGFLRALQQLGDIAEHKFPVLVTNFSQLEGDDIRQAFAFEQILRDRKSPISSCEAVVLKSTQDVGLFEQAVAQLFSSISTELSPLESERRDDCERQARLTQEFGRARAAAKVQSPIRNSFFDGRVIPLGAPAPDAGGGRTKALQNATSSVPQTPVRVRSGAAHVSRLGLSSAQDFAFRTPNLATSWSRTPKLSADQSQLDAPRLDNRARPDEQSAQLKSLLESIAQAERLLGDNDTIMT